MTAVVTEQQRTPVLEGTTPHSRGPKVPSHLVRAWFAVGTLAFALGYAAFRYIEVVLVSSAWLDPKVPPDWVFYPGGDPWMVGDWLINYGGGFVRRGLFGHLFLTLAPAGQAGLWTLFGIQMSLYLLLFAYCVHVLHRSRYSWSVIALVCGPAGLAFIGWTPNIDAAFRKEILPFAVLVLLAWARSRTRSRPGVVGLVLGALALHVLAVFSWEPSALLLPAMLYLLLHKGAPHPDLDTVRRSAAALFLVVSGLGGVLSFLIHGDVATAQAICDTVRENGFTSTNVCSGGVLANGGAIEAIGWTSYKTAQDLAVALPVYVGFLPLIALSALPVVASAWFRTNWRWAALIVLGVAPLFFIVTDYGRWTHMLAVAFMVCITADDPDQARSRMWTPLATILYVGAWGLPHWMGQAQFGKTWWPQVGLFTTLNDRILLRAWDQQPSLLERPTGGPLELAGRYLGGAPASGWDSWSAMQLALEHISVQGADQLYQSVLGAGIKFQYFPTSLLFVEPAFLYAPKNLALAMNIVNWVAVAATVWVMFRLLMHLAATTRLFRLTGGTITALLGVAAVSTVTFRPVTWAWDLGQAQVLINFFCTLALYAYLRGSKPLSGVALALACLLKPQLGLFALWGLVRRDWRFLGYLVGTAAAGVLLSVARYGLKAHLDYLGVLSFLSQRGESYYPNQSVNGLLHRVLHTDDFLNLDFTSFPPFDRTVYGGSTAATLVFVALALLVALAGRRTSAPAVPTPQSLIAGLDFGVGMLCFTVASPIAWDHHYGVLLPVYALAVFMTLQLRRQVAIPILGTLAVSYGLMISELYPSLRPLAEGPLNVLYSYVLFAAVLLLACLLVLRHHYIASSAAAGGRGPSEDEAADEDRSASRSSPTSRVRGVTTGARPGTRRTSPGLGSVEDRQSESVPGERPDDAVDRWHEHRLELAHGGVGDRAEDAVDRQSTG